MTFKFFTCMSTLDLSLSPTPMHHLSGSTKPFQVYPKCNFHIYHPAPGLRCTSLGCHDIPFSPLHIVYSEHMSQGDPFNTLVRPYYTLPKTLQRQLASPNKKPKSFEWPSQTNLPSQHLSYLIFNLSLSSPATQASLMFLKYAKRFLLQPASFLKCSLNVSSWLSSSFPGNPCANTTCSQRPSLTTVYNYIAPQLPCPLRYFISLTF